MGIEKVVKTFSIFDKTFFKNCILLCALKAHVSKIHLILLIGEDIIIYINKIVHTNKFIILIKMIKIPKKKKILKYIKTTKKRMSLFEVNCKLQWYVAL